jgi:FAD/FMN-containing dehydrogenase
MRAWDVAGRATVEGGLMIDLSLMKGIHVDPTRRTVRAQGGATWADLNRETQLHGLAVTGGVVSTTGIAGLTLGGGIGWLMGNRRGRNRLLQVLYIGGDVMRPNRAWRQAAIVAPGEEPGAGSGISAARVGVADVGREKLDIAPGGLVAEIGDQRRHDVRRTLVGGNLDRRDGRRQLVLGSSGSFKMAPLPWYLRHDKGRYH